MKNIDFIKTERLSRQESDILYSLYHKPFVNQRILSETVGYSVGVVNRSLKRLITYGYIDEKASITEKSRMFFERCVPKNAIILAAGFGMRMVPINLTTPKGLIEVHGERLIDRLIKQLHEVGIKDITVVVGFMKDSFEYLIDEYEVNLSYAADYASTNNIYSLNTVADRINNTYIIPCDIWCKSNPFRDYELYSWYMVSDGMNYTSGVRVNRKLELVKVPQYSSGNSMIGISYLSGIEAENVKSRIKTLVRNKKCLDKFWEEALYEDDRMIVQARVVPAEKVVEINTYEELREIDSNSNQLKSDVLETIAGIFECRSDDIVDIKVLKKGMTNRSFLFQINRGINAGKYIMRIPGEGTDKLINRQHEAEVFSTISGFGLCDTPVYINPKNGYKITRFLDGVRTCNPNDMEDLKRCMEKLRAFHQKNFKVSHTFDIFGQIDFYEMLWEGAPSIYNDYERTKEKILSLRSFIDGLKKDWCLTHIDAVPDNFLFYKSDGEIEEKLQLTDWEYSGMQDPHVDIAMFCIYSMYNRHQCDHLIDIYFEGKCDKTTRAKIYAYIAMCGLLWSNWCEYKRKLGVEFGEYSLRQYRYAKDYYKYVKEMMYDNGISEGI